jgi:Berberine and berberine like
VARRGSAASLKVTATGDVDRPPSVDVYGAVLGTGSDAADLFDQLVVDAGSDPISSSLEHLSFPETRRFWAQLGDGDQAGDEDAGPSEPVYLFARSEFFRRPPPADAIAALVDAFARDRVLGESRELDFMPWGGAYNRVAPDATAFVHRTELFQLKHAIVVRPDASVNEKEAAHGQVARSWATVHSSASGRVFQNFADPELESWADAYYMVRTWIVWFACEERYDPENVFRFEQSIRPR